jgi:hypothetical protein
MMVIDENDGIQDSLRTKRPFDDCFVIPMMCLCFAFFASFERVSALSVFPLL